MESFNNFHTLLIFKNPTELPTSYRPICMPPCLLPVSTSVPVTDLIVKFVNDIPSNISEAHGGPDELSAKLNDLLFPRPPVVSDQPKKRGRPAGSKNKSKAADVSADVSELPKKRGRPAGSKNKPKKSIAAAILIQRTWRARHSPNQDSDPEVNELPKKRGRPAGSKNKPKTTTATKRRGPNQHTRKSKKSTAAATVIQRAWRASR